jgi:hypothetical protein
MAARTNSSCAPRGPRSRSRPRDALQMYETQLDQRLPELKQRSGRKYLSNHHQASLRSCHFANVGVLPRVRFAPEAAYQK